MIRFAAALAALLAFAGVARADVQPLPYVAITTPSSCPLSNCSSGGAGAVTALNANPGRKMFCVANRSSDTIAFAMGLTASATVGFPVGAGGFACMGGALIWQGPVSVYTPAADTFDIEEFQ